MTLASRRRKISGGEEGLDMAVVTLVACLALIVATPAEADVKSLSYADLASGGFALAGVTTMIGDSTSRMEDRPTLDTVTLAAFRERRGDLVLDGADWVQATLGEEGYRSMLDHFERTAQLDSKALASLAADSSSHVRYAMLARIEEIDVDCDHEDAPPDENPVYSHLPKEEMEIVTVKRTVKARFRIFDSRNGKIVWDTSHSKKVDVWEKVPKEPRAFKGGSIAGMIEDVVSSHPGDPPAPPLTSALAKVVEEFAKKLPKKGKK